MIILIDSREKSQAHIVQWLDQHKIEHETLALPSGDYSFALNPIPELDINQKQYFYNDIIIERKIHWKSYPGVLRRQENASMMNGAGAMRKENTF